MQKKIIEWNRDRDLLGKFDPKLEIKLLTEELNEFYMAETFSEALAEAADFIFVWKGAKAIFYSTEFNSVIEFKIAKENFDIIKDWAESALKEINTVLLTKYWDVGHLKLTFDECKDFALRSVIKNNNLKGKNKVDGKIQKSPKQINPADVIREKIYD